VGFGGTELLTDEIRHLRLLSSSTDVRRLLERYFKYSDIYRDEVMTEDHYYNSLKEGIEELLARIGSDRFLDVATYLRFSTFSRYYHGTLMAAHNCILPCYSPYFEANFAKLMFETSYGLKHNHCIQRIILSELNPSVSLIMTSHGYSAHWDGDEDFNILRRAGRGLKHLSVRLIYQFRFLRKTKDSLHDQLSRIWRPTMMAEIDRRFWVRVVKDSYLDDMRIFDVIDRDKFKNTLNRRSDRKKLLAKVVYLNRLIEEYVE
jgi:hypothetical protein